MFSQKPQGFMRRRQIDQLSIHKERLLNAIYLVLLVVSEGVCFLKLGSVEVQLRRLVCVFADFFLNTPAITGCLQPGCLSQMLIA